MWSSGRPLPLPVVVATPTYPTFLGPPPHDRMSVLDSGHGPIFHRPTYLFVLCAMGTSTRVVSSVELEGYLDKSCV